MTQTEVIMQREISAHEIRQVSKTKIEAAESKIAGRVTEAKLKSVYRLFDADDSGFVLVSDLANLFRALGATLDEESLETVNEKAYAMAELEGGRVPYDKFITLFEEYAKYDSVAEAKRMYAAMCSEEEGKLTIESLAAALALSEARVSEKEIAEVLKMCDIDGDGTVSEEDFLRVVEFSTTVGL